MDNEIKTIPLAVWGVRSKLSAEELENSVFDTESMTYRKRTEEENIPYSVICEQARLYRELVNK